MRTYSQALDRISPIALLLAALAGCGQSVDSTIDPRSMAWPQIEQAARGREVRLVMWTGDPAINRYMQDFIVPRLKRRYDITLHIVPGQADIPNLLATEAAAGRTTSSMDMVWINGEVAYKLRQMHALFGPFTAQLPNNTYVDWRNPQIALDFQQVVAGDEAPWGNVQLLLIVDSARVLVPPADPSSLAAWITAHPGRFTFDTAFTGLSFLKSLMYACAESPAELTGPFDEKAYVRLRDRVFAWVHEVQPALWRAGKTFPKDVAQLHQLFANGEVDFTMSFNDGEVDNKVANGLFPSTARAYALTTGTLANSHFLGIVAHAPEPAAAMVVINELESIEAQYEKQKPSVWGDGTVLDVARLPPPWPARFAAIPGRERAPDRAALAKLARAEPAPEYMIRLDRDFRQQFIEQ